MRAAYRRGSIPPRVVPFQISLEQAQAAFEAWQRSNWLAPSRLLRRGLVGMRAALLPFWLFEATVRVEYTGEPAAACALLPHALCCRMRSAAACALMPFT
jgi:hypothetical protein